MSVDDVLMQEVFICSLGVDFARYIEEPGIRGFSAFDAGLARSLLSFFCEVKAQSPVKRGGVVKILKGKGE